MSYNKRFYSSSDPPSVVKNVMMTLTSLPQEKVGLIIELAHAANISPRSPKGDNRDLLKRLWEDARTAQARVLADLATNTKVSARAFVAAARNSRSAAYG
jgi:hypothetical protein